MLRLHFPDRIRDPVIQVLPDICDSIYIHFIVRDLSAAKSLRIFSAVFQESHDQLYLHLLLGTVYRLAAERFSNKVTKTGKIPIPVSVSISLRFLPQLLDFP